jgi:DNA methylase
MTTATLQIEPAFQQLITPLTNEELAQLEANILAEGCRDPLVVWDGTIIDGHHRHTICMKHSIPFQTVERHFASYDEAKIWIIHNQFGRRNLSAYTRGVLALQLKDMLAAQARARILNGKAPDPSENFRQGKTSEQLAEVAGVSDRTIEKIAFIEQYADADIKAQLHAGDTSIHKAYTELKREQQQQRLDKRARHDAQARANPNKPTIWQASWETWLPQQPTCDLLLTDPPYATDIEDIDTFAKAWLPIALAKVKPTGRAYVCIGPYPRELRAYLSADHVGLTLEQILVWEYRNAIGPKPARTYKQNWQAIFYFCGPDAPALDCPELVEQFSVQDINAPDGRLGDRYHTWQKPDLLAERLIRHSTHAGQLVLDPFAGTGSFVLASTRLGREARGCDTCPDMLAIAAERGAAISWAGGAEQLRRSMVDGYFSERNGGPSAAMG